MDDFDKQPEYDYSFVDATARIALYDDLRSAPRITNIEPAATNDFIENLTVAIYEQSKMAGGKIPYSVIREVSENFIHAQFREIVVSILDDGNTIRFADQGPGIKEKERAQRPGFSSAIEPMKEYIRGVGSGFPIVTDYLNDREGSIVIEDNLISGAVITISLRNKKDGPATAKQPSTHPIEAVPQEGITVAMPHITLNEREKRIIDLLYTEGDLGITDLHNLMDIAPSSVHNTLKKLKEAGLVDTTVGKKRTLTAYGREIASSIQ